MFSGISPGAKGRKGLYYSKMSLMNIFTNPKIRITNLVCARYNRVPLGEIHTEKAGGQGAR